MRDYLGNPVNVGDTIVFATKNGKTPELRRGLVTSSDFRPPYRGFLSTDMLLVEISNVHTIWIPSTRAIKIPDNMVPEKRKARFNEIVEAVQP